MAADPAYLNDIGTLIDLDTGEDISSATVQRIKYRKPSGATGYWVGVIGTDTTSVEYTTIDGDLDEIGTWTTQVYIEMPTWKGHSTMITFKVVDPIA